MWACYNLKWERPKSLRIGSNCSQTPHLYTTCEAMWVQTCLLLKIFTKVDFHPIKLFSARVTLVFNTKMPHYAAAALTGLQRLSLELHWFMVV